MNADAVLKKNPTLAELQQTFLESITHPRFEVYRDSIEGIHIKALRSTYPVCHKLVGDDFFNTMARVYIKQYPSRIRNLYEYGENLPTFIATFPPAFCLPYLSSVASLEWAWLKAFLGQDYQPLDGTALLTVSENTYPSLVFHLPKNSSLLASPYPIHRIWQANQSEYPDDNPIHLNEGSAKLFIWRRDQKVNIEVLDDEQWQLLCDIANKVPLATLCQKVSLFNFVVQNGWIEGFSIS